jgi:hypothetical protein
MSNPASQKPKPIATALVDRRPILGAMSNPHAIALISATETPDSVGHTLMDNLLSFGRPFYPANSESRRGKN